LKTLLSFILVRMAAPSAVTSLVDDGYEDVDPVPIELIPRYISFTSATDEFSFFIDK